MKKIAIKPGMVISCKTQLEADMLLQYLQHHGYDWINRSHFVCSLWKDEKDCFQLTQDDIFVSHRRWYEEDGYQITPFADTPVSEWFAAQETRTGPYTLQEVLNFIDTTGISKKDACQLKSMIADIWRSSQTKIVSEFAKEIGQYTYGRMNGVYIDMPQYKVEIIANDILNKFLSEGDWEQDEMELS